MRRLSFITALSLIATHVVWAAPLPPGVKRMGTVITAEGGIEGTQVYRYDENNRPIDLIPSKPIPAKPVWVQPDASHSPTGKAAPSLVARPPSQPLPAPLVVAPPVTAKAQTQPTNSFKTADGRAVPFSLQGQGVGKKEVDEAVDFNASLKKAGKKSDLLDKRYETGTATISKDQVYSRDNLLTLDQWHGRYDTFGRKKADLEIKDTLGAKVVPKGMVEVKSIDRANSTINGTLAEVQEWEARMGVETNKKFAGVKSDWEGRLKPKQKSIDQLSMQDINRYQFRRNRSDVPGLPTVKPGSEEVKNKSPN